MRPKTSFRRILVAVGGPRPHSTAAVAKAAQIARACGARLELYHDLAEPVLIGSERASGGMRRYLQESRDAVLAGLERLAAPLRRRGIEVHTAAEWDYPAHEAIVRHALQTGADLIVTQTRARHRFAGLLGYTDWTLLRDSPVPVLLVKSPRRYGARGAVLAAIDPQHSFAKPRGLDANILRETAALARALHAAPHVVHAYLPLPLPPFTAAPPSARRGRQLETSARAKASATLARALEGSSIARAHRHLLESHPVDAILQTARRTRAGVVVMGAISRHGLRRLFIGNTAEQLLDELPCDLLVVKPSRFATPVSRTRRGARFLTTPAFS